MGAMKGNTRSLDYSLYRPCVNEPYVSCICGTHLVTTHLEVYFIRDFLNLNPKP